MHKCHENSIRTKIEQVAHGPSCNISGTSALTQNHLHSDTFSHTSSSYRAQPLRSPIPRLPLLPTHRVYLYLHLYPHIPLRHRNVFPSATDTASSLSRGGGGGYSGADSRSLYAFCMCGISAAFFPVSASKTHTCSIAHSRSSLVCRVQSAFLPHTCPCFGSIVPNTDLARARSLSPPEQRP